jgi:radical SAM superfamily enzyme YgiQ (UPF0313 family)
MYVPLNIGYIAQYCRQCFSNDVELQLFKDPTKLLQHALEEAPDVIGLSFYYWNIDLNHALVRRLRGYYGKGLTVIWGGPSVGTDLRELQGLFSRYPEVDAFVINEGELGFVNAIAGLVQDATPKWSKPIDGAVFQLEGELVLGRPVGLTLDLGLLQSPYLNGLLDEFLVGDYIPMLQTSRLCPYTCAFCTSGKNRGKLRAFPIDQVKAEIDLVCDRFSDRPYMGLLLSDENFGILSRDVELAEYIRESKSRTGYPKSIFFYNDKRFTETSKKVIESLGQINTHGLILSLQSENPETLKEVKRKNLSPEDIAAAIKWAADRNMPTSTELIFGMPYETRKSFSDLLSSSVEKGFDSILGFNLFLMDGIELNTPSKREQHGVRTMFRPVGTYYGLLDGEFTAETEEIVVETKYFTFEDYLLIRSLNFAYYAVFALLFYRWYFQYIRHSGVDMSQFMLEFVSPTIKAEDLPPGHLQFCENFRRAIVGELFESREAVKNHLKALFKANNGEVDEPIRQNIFYGARLIYLEADWVANSLRGTLRKFLSPAQHPDVFKTADFILDLCAKERMNLQKDETPEPILSQYDVISWRSDKFKGPLENYRIAPRFIEFSYSEDTRERIKSFRDEFGSHFDNGFYYFAMDFMNRRELLYQLNYVST